MIFDISIYKPHPDYRETLVSVERSGNFTRNAMTEIDNVYLFKGSDNSVIINRIYETRWICNYAMNFFPFDTQKCAMVLTPTEELGKFIRYK